MNHDTYQRFGQAVEAQSLRQIKRFLDYGKRVRRQTGLEEMGQWIGRVLHDQEDVYGEAEKALAFEVGACEWLARRWWTDTQDGGALISIIGQVDKVRLLRLLLLEDDAPRRRGLQQALRERYHKVAGWIEERAQSLDADTEDTQAPHERLLLYFAAGLEEVDPLGTDTGTDTDTDQSHAEALAAAAQQQHRLQRELESSSARAERAVERLENLKQEINGLRRTVREERVNGEKLRQERSRRIKIERDSREAATQLQRLRDEYVKLDQRLRDSAHRQGQHPQPLLAQLEQMSAADLLGVSTAADAQTISQIRRRFAATFHPDRAGQLPRWVADLFDHLLGLVNAACDRANK